MYRVKPQYIYKENMSLTRSVKNNNKTYYNEKRITKTCIKKKGKQNQKMKECGQNEQNKNKIKQRQQQ